MSELLIRRGTVIAMDQERSVGARDVLVRAGRIHWLGAVGRAPRAQRGVPRETIDARGCVVVPGFVQAHVHLCQVLFRGLADDLPLMRWLRERIWPFEAAHDRKSLRASAELGLCELLRSGTTTILDMGTVHHHEVVFEAMARFGIRGVSGKAMMDVGEGVPRGLCESTRESLAESDALRAAFEGKGDGRLSYAYAPRFVLSCTKKLLCEVGERVRGEQARVHTHVAEHASEREEVQRLLGCDDLAYFEDCGIHGPRTVMAHGVQLTTREMRRAAKLGTRFAHCPSANLKLASGIADVVRMRKAGLVVGLGADGAPCNNRLDGLGELRLAALLAKHVQHDAAALSAMDALSLLTIDGARCLGLDADIGSLEVGKRADITVVQIDGVAQAPALDPVSALVYASTAADVRDVVVDGIVRVRGRELLGIDEGRVVARARREALRVVKSLG